MTAQKITIDIDGEGVSIPAPRHSLIAALGEWIKGERQYFSDLSNGLTTSHIGKVRKLLDGDRGYGENQLITIHIIGGGMQIRNWMRTRIE